MRVFSGLAFWWLGSHAAHVDERSCKRRERRRQARIDRVRSAAR